MPFNLTIDWSVKHVLSVPILYFIYAEEAFYTL